MNSPISAVVRRLLPVVLVAGCAGGAAPPDGAATRSVTAPTTRPAPASCPPAASSGTDTPTTSDGEFDDGAGNASSAPAPARALANAEAFAHAWARPDLDPGAWLAGVTRTLRRTTRPPCPQWTRAPVPARAVTGAAQVVSSNTAVVVLDIPLDTGALRITCVEQDGDWLVSDARLRGRRP